MGSILDQIRALWCEIRDRRWVAAALLFWLGTAIVLLQWRWGGIQWFALGDTDDNLRIAQVRAWLAGQGWYDLRQYRLDPPLGADIHWSRIPDLPIAGIMLLGRLLVSGATAEKAAVAIAPMLPLIIAMLALAITARRLIAPGAFVLALVALVSAQAVMNMFAPLRIDHHGWQLAMLAVMVAGGADPDRRRGGLTAGIAAAVSLSIGLEMLPYVALAAGAVALAWVWDEHQRDRLRGFGLALGLGATVGFLLFASYANRRPVCDALSPVWLSVALAGGGGFVGLAAMAMPRRGARLALAAAAAALIAIGFALAWPQCLGTPERLTPELRRMWFDNIREAKPLFSHGWRMAAGTLALPAAGLIGGLAMLWRTRGTDAARGWATALLLAVAAIGLLFWQTRASPAANLLAVPGAAAFGWLLGGWLFTRLPRIPAALLTLLVLLLATGLGARATLWAIPEPPPKKSRSAAGTAARRCPTLPALRPIARLPAATILTHVDLGPRLIAVTHHRAIAGPYHRNQQAILDIHRAFRGSDELARAVMRRHGATLLLVCPGIAESTVYVAQARHGFYARLMKGRVPGWLQPVPLPRSSPYRLWRRVE